VLNYDRRGRGDSGDTLPYAVQREVEDIQALAESAGGSANLVGWSSGAVLALEAACRLPGRIQKLAMYEPPFIVDGSRPPVPADYVPHLTELNNAGKRAEAAEYFLTAAMLLPPEYIAGLKASPNWNDLLSVAHTIAYDGLVMGDSMRGKPLDTSRWAGANLPVLVITGGASPEFFHSAAKALVAGLPNARHSVLPGQSHGVEAAALAPLLVEFFHSKGK
jgi:pimeloyl-ACP methyl ester carboxylesterase